jgi:hypothetical protein
MTNFGKNSYVNNNIIIWWNDFLGYKFYKKTYFNLWIIKSIIFSLNNQYCSTILTWLTNTLLLKESFKEALLALSYHDYKITNLYVGLPGSVSNSRAIGNLFGLYHQTLYVGLFNMSCRFTRWYITLFAWINKGYPSSIHASWWALHKNENVVLLNWNF